jgi:hypothetical protein
MHDDSHAGRLRVNTIRKRASEEWTLGCPEASYITTTSHKPPKSTRPAPTGHMELFEISQVTTVSKTYWKKMTSE